MPRQPSRFAAWRARLSERLAHSSQFFLLGLIVACGVEVLVDWNQTLFEVNVLRDQIRQKGLNYAGILERAIVDPLVRRDHKMLERLASGVLDDEDAVFLRVVDQSGKTVYERIDQRFELDYLRRGKGSFGDHYGHWLDRDLRGILFDPDGFKQRLSASRYRDLPQIYNDVLGQVVGWFVTPSPLPPLRAQIVYQDRLRDENRRRDDTTTWALVPLLTESATGSSQVGALLIAFDMSRVNGSVRTKYLKGLGMIVFFVALILIQSITARRDKLRLLDVGRRYAAAKLAIFDAMRKESLSLPSDGSSLTITGQVDQAKEAVDGMVFDARICDGHAEVLVADPDGDGIDAASIGLHILKCFRAQGSLGLDVQAGLLGAATTEIPLTRPIGLLLLRVEPSGSFEALLGEKTQLLLFDQPVMEQPRLLPMDSELPPGIVGPLYRSSGTIPPGSTLLCMSAGRELPEERARDEAALAATLRAQESNPERVLDEVAAWLRRRYPSLRDNDFAIVAIRRPS